jgi:hypothetical protein
MKPGGKMFKEREIVWWKKLLCRVRRNFNDGTHIEIIVSVPDRGWDAFLIVDQKELMPYVA